MKAHHMLLLAVAISLCTPNFVQAANANPGASAPKTEGSLPADGNKNGTSSVEAKSAGAKEKQNSGTVSANMMKSPSMADFEKAAGAASGGSAPGLTKRENPVVKKWTETRPSESAIDEYMAKIKGKTIVDVTYEGASEATLATVKKAGSLRAGDSFDADAFNKDREAIFNTGYFYDLYPGFEEVPEGVIINYHLLENPVLKDVVFEGNTALKTEKLQSLVTMKRGEILNSGTLHRDMEAISEAYRGEGYILAKITDMDVSPEGVLTLKFNEGILEGYKIKGNQKTKDRVILREMRQKPGEPFNAKLARRSVQRVMNLGFFEDVNLKMNPGVAPGAIVMELDVKERRTGTFGIGAGYSSTDGVLGMVSLSDTNFRGTGDSASIAYEVSGEETDAHGYSFSYRRPWLDKKETAATIRIYNRTYRYSDYDTEGDLKEEYMRKYSGFELTFSRPVSEYSTNYLTLRNRKDRYIRNYDTGNMGDRSGPAFEEWRKHNFGITRSLVLEHITDTRDNVYEPSEGGRVALTGEFAGWGGDFNFRKFSIEDQRYKKVGRNQVFAARVAYGFGTGKISEYNQFRIGGQDTLRGYRDDQYRGNRMFSGSFEYRFPLVSKVRGAFFTDWGAAWDRGVKPQNMKASLGFGIFLNTPMGPLRLDYGRGSNGGRVHFSVGTTF